jgi:hypothetical protein
VRRTVLRASSWVPQVFLSEQPFSPYFKDKVDAFLAGRPSQPKAQYGLVSKEDWDIPAHIDMAKAKQRWKKMKDGGYIPYAGSKSYRQMCRCVYISRAWRERKREYHVH